MAKEAKPSLTYLHMKPVDKSEILFHMKLPLPYPIKKTLEVEQEAEGKILIHSKSSLTANKYKNDGTVAKRVFLNLTGTEVQPNMSKGNDWFKGFFTEKIMISVTPSADMALVFDDPHGVNHNSVESKTVSFTASEGVGMMGGQPMANLGYNFTTSKGASTTIQNYTLSNYSKASILKHEIDMTSAGDGNPYDVAHPGQGLLPRIFDLSPGDLFLQGLEFFNPDSVMYDEDKLRPLPDLATQNFPIVSQGIWETTSPELLDSKVYFQINMDVVFLGVRVEKNNGLDVKYHTHRLLKSWENGLNVDLSQVGVT